MNPHQMRGDRRAKYHQRHDHDPSVVATGKAPRGHHQIAAGLEAIAPPGRNTHEGKRCRPSHCGDGSHTDGFGDDARQSASTSHPPIVVANDGGTSDRNRCVTPLEPERSPPLG
jgi:hypothetical protein